MARSVLLAGVELGGIDGFIWTGLGEPLYGRLASQCLCTLLVWVALPGFWLVFAPSVLVGRIIAVGRPPEFVPAPYRFARRPLPGETENRFLAGSARAPLG